MPELSPSNSQDVTSKQPIAFHSAAVMLSIKVSQCMVVKRRKACQHHQKKNLRQALAESKAIYNSDLMSNHSHGHALQSP